MGDRYMQKQHVVQKHLEGFSVVEISIVLAIVALLYICVSTGSNLVTTSRKQRALGTSMLLMQGMKNLALWYDVWQPNTLRVQQNNHLTHWLSTVNPEYFLEPTDINGNYQLYLQKYFPLQHIPALHLSGDAGLVLQNYELNNNYTVVLVFSPEKNNGNAPIISSGSGMTAVFQTNTNKININRTSGGTTLLGVARPHAINFLFLTNDGTSLHASLNMAPVQIIAKGIYEDFGKLSLGCYNTLSCQTDLAVVELLIFRQALSAVEQQQVEHYLTSKYNP